MGLCRRMRVPRVRHVDIADGMVAVREAQARPLAAVRARLARVYVTGNHEYFSEAQGWLDYMAAIGWDALRNKHVLVERGETDSSSRVSTTGRPAPASRPRRRSRRRAGGRRPRAAGDAARASAQAGRAGGDAGVDLQISGHTHGGQIWPFNYLVRLDQPVVQGLSRHGERT